MIHIDSTDVTHKKEAYSLLIAQVEALLESEHDTIANLANVSALLYEGMRDINWVGFYLLKDKELVVGPFQGKVACSRLPLTKGVCAQAAITKTIQNIHDVHAFDGHIACDSASESELVVPMIKNDVVLGVLDIDAPIKQRFDAEDEALASAVVNLLIKKLPDHF